MLPYQRNPRQKKALVCTTIATASLTAPLWAPHDAIGLVGIALGSLALIAALAFLLLPESTTRR